MARLLVAGFAPLGETTSSYGRFLFGLMALWTSLAQALRVGAGSTLRRQREPLGCVRSLSISPPSCGGASMNGIAVQAQRVNCVWRLLMIQRWNKPLY
jgi:hypothetical protein